MIFLADIINATVPRWLSYLYRNTH